MAHFNLHKSFVVKDREQPTQYATWESKSWTMRRIWSKIPREGPSARHVPNGGNPEMLLDKGTRYPSGFGTQFILTVH